MNVASGLLFSSEPDSGCAPAPSPKSIVAVRASFHPGSVIAPPICSVVFSLRGEFVVIVPAFGATFVTFTVAVSVCENPLALVTCTPTVKSPSWPTSVKVGFWPVASSYWPSLSRSHAYVDGPSPRSVEPDASSCVSVPSLVVYGPPASAVGVHAAGPSVAVVGVMSPLPVVEAEKPISRLAKMPQIRQLSAPARLVWLATSRLSRVARNVGPCGVVRIPSTISWKAAVLAGSSSYFATSALRMSHHVAAQISPSAWTSQPMVRIVQRLEYFNVLDAIEAVRRPRVALPELYSPITGSSHFAAETMSLQPSPSAPVWTAEPRLPFWIRRPDRPWPYSWAMMSPSIAESRCGVSQRYICILEPVPSAEVLKFALSTQRLAVPPSVQFVATPSS